MVRRAILAGLTLVLIFSIVGEEALFPEGLVFTGAGALLLGVVFLGEVVLRRQGAANLLGGGLGATVGLGLAALLLVLAESLFNLVPPGATSEGLGRFLGGMVVLILAYLGWVTGSRVGGEVGLGRRPEGEQVGRLGMYLLDADGLVDGRVVRLAEAGLLYGEVVVPRFVVDTLRSMTGSSEHVQRLRGQRGLDNLQALERVDHCPVYIREIELSPGEELEGIVRYAEAHQGRIMTQNPHLLRPARREGVPAVDLNDLLTALSPEVAAGDELVIKLVKPGKEKDQAVGYLDDGNMVVVENGRDQIGKTVRVVVTGIHQTRAGTLIFSQVKE